LTFGNKSFKKKIIINGIGCPYSGGYIVLQNLLNSIPIDYFVMAFLPKGKSVKIAKINGNNTKVYYFNIKYWSMLFRPFYEIIKLYFVIIRGYKQINISNYGLCLNNNNVLYIHNLNIIDLDVKTGFGHGNANVFTRFLLNNSIRHSKVFVQSDHMAILLLNYMKKKKIFNKNVITIKPILDIDVHLNKPIEKKYKYQFFYPASNFPHKNIDFALKCFSEVNSKSYDVGLLITSEKMMFSSNISYLGQINYNEVINILNSSDFLFFSSERETLGLPLLEGILLEKPALLPNLAYAKEIYGDAAVYYNNFSFVEFERALKYLIENFNYYKNKVRLRKSLEIEKRKTWTQHWEEFLK